MKITMEIADDHAFALGKICKRLSFAELQANASSDAEIKLMTKATWAVQQALAAAGVDVGR